MAEGETYFAWVNANETTFDGSHLRQDENVLAWTFEHAEGDFATLEIRVRRPRNLSGNAVGLLGPGRKIWAWWAFDCGTDLVKGLFRLVGSPPSDTTEAVTLRFIARPANFTGQKAALAEALKVTPYWDEVFVDEQHRDDPDLVLEAYSRRWYISPDTHVVSTSDILIGEDGVEEFAADEMLYEGFGYDFGSPPLTSVKADILFTWTQAAKGNIDLTKYLTDAWPNEDPLPGIITSFTFGGDSWPKVGSGIGEGWTVAQASALYADLQVQNRPSGGKTIVIWTDGVTTNLEVTRNDAFLSTPVLEGIGTNIEIPSIITDHQFQYKTDRDEDGNEELASMSSSTNWTDGVIPLLVTRPTLTVAYDVQRECKERVTFTLVADMQPILTDPGEDESADLKLNSANLSEEIPVDTGSELPIGDVKRRSYVVTDRGQDSLMHVVARARAMLLNRARAIDITFAPVKERMPGVSLRKNALIHDTRLPGGEAVGKIIAYSMALDGETGHLECTVKMGCAIGRGGEVEATAGDPTYIEDGYIEDGYFEREGQTILFDTSVGYGIPQFAPNDDGIEFLGTGPTVEMVIEQDLSVTNPPAVQRAELNKSPWIGYDNAGLVGMTNDQRQEAVQKRNEGLRAVLEKFETEARFKLRSVRKPFETNYDLAVTDLKVPTQIDLEAA